MKFKPTISREEKNMYTLFRVISKTNDEKICEFETMYEAMMAAEESDELKKLNVLKICDDKNKSIIGVKDKSTFYWRIPGPKTQNSRKSNKRWTNILQMCI